MTEEAGVIRYLVLCHGIFDGNISPSANDYPTIVVIYLCRQTINYTVDRDRLIPSRTEKQRDNCLCNRVDEKSICRKRKWNTGLIYNVYTPNALLHVPLL